MCMCFNELLAAKSLKNPKIPPEDNIEVGGRLSRRVQAGLLGGCNLIWIRDACTQALLSCLLPNAAERVFAGVSQPAAGGAWHFAHGLAHGLLCRLQAPTSSGCLHAVRASTQPHAWIHPCAPAS